MTSIRSVRLAATAWAPRGQGDEPIAAAMPIVVEVVGSTVRLVPDLAHYIADQLAWAVYGENVVPADTLPAGVLANNYPAGSFALRTQQSQPAPNYDDQDALPDTSLVRLDVVQTLTKEFADLELLYDRRVEVEELLSGLNADVGEANP